MRAARESFIKPFSENLREEKTGFRKVSVGSFLPDLPPEVRLQSISLSACQVLSVVVVVVVVVVGVVVLAVVVVVVVVVVLVEVVVVAVAVTVLLVEIVVPLVVAKVIHWQ
ncbi:hypothetical protein ElyMa_002008800 [Elysia marginata]|uniref:ABC transmembrane type-1 domain-containing protein n=1 Tax=Elysia marginata TaxID=1093978 RepID=A0AAV4F333_9GAST|nr:hypothetical protein ElyMa_002008800 [Elysia marginata]